MKYSLPRAADCPIIFDFDGVIVDSEALASRILADYLEICGMPVSEHEIATRFVGMRLIECIQVIERTHNRAVPSGFYDGLHAFGRKIFSTHLRTVHGADAFIQKCTGRQIAIASSSDMQHITHSLEVVGLHSHFHDRIFSAARMERGKPHPDVYLAATRAINVQPDTCIAIEDSERGVRSAVSAGLYTIGLTAASHCNADTADALRSAGAHAVAGSYQEIEALIGLDR